MKFENNSKWAVGSAGWRNTLLGQIKHIGEFLTEKTPDEEILREWGKSIYSNASDMIDFYQGHNPKQTVISFEEQEIDKLIKSAFRYELTDEEIKSHLTSFLKSYRWHVIERAKAIAELAIQTANSENEL